MSTTDATGQKPSRSKSNRGAIFLGNYCNVKHIAATIQSFAAWAYRSVRTDPASQANCAPATPV
jgi:hypothetical protein